MMNQRLDGKVAVITGAAGPMGAAVVAELAGIGCRVAMVDVNESALTSLAERHERHAVSAHVCDIRDLADVNATHARIQEQMGPVDILVNNAGILSNNKVMAATLTEWRNVLAVNLDGAFFWSRAVVPAMKERRWGRIINTGSLASKTGGLTAGTAYSVSKGAIGALTFSLARELAGFGITVNALAPAYVRTPMVTHGLSEDQREALLRQIPVGRFCEPDEFAFAVAFLASTRAGFITGEVLDVNGGLHMD